MKTPCHEHGNVFIAVCWCRIETAEIGPFISCQPGFFPKLPLCGRKTVFLFAVEFSCGNFCDDGIKRITILPLYNDFSLVCHRDDTHGTDMPNDFTGTLVPVRQTDGVPFHIQNDTVKDILRFYLYFTEFLHFFFKIKNHIHVPALMFFTKPLYHILSL